MELNTTGDQADLDLEGQTVLAEVTTQPSEYDRAFRFVRSFGEPPTRIHVSTGAARRGDTSLDELTRGTLVNATLTRGTDRSGNPSWTATVVTLAPPGTQKPRRQRPARAESQHPAYIGCIDSGSPQEMHSGTAWFAENVYPTASRNARIFADNLEAGLDPSVLSSGTWVAWHGSVQAPRKVHPYDPARFPTRPLVQHLGHYPLNAIAEIISTIRGRGDAPALAAECGQLPDRVVAAVVNAAREDEDLVSVLAWWPRATQFHVLERCTPAELEQVDDDVLLDHVGRTSQERSLTNVLGLLAGRQLLSEVLQRHGTNSQVVAAVARSTDLAAVVAIAGREARATLLRNVNSQVIASCSDPHAVAVALFDAAPIPGDARGVAGVTREWGALLGPFVDAARASDHPLLWYRPEAAAGMIDALVGEGATVEGAVLRLQSDGADPDTVLPLAADRHPGWALEFIRDADSFGRLGEWVPVETRRRIVQACESVLPAGEVDPVARTLTHLINDVSTGWLEAWARHDHRPADREEVLDGLAELISERARSGIECGDLPVEVRGRSEDLWGPGINGLAEVLGFHAGRCAAGAADSEAVGITILARILDDHQDSVNRPERWTSQLPPLWLETVRAALQTAPAIYQSLQTNSALGAFSRPLGFKGPARVWLEHRNLDAAWPTLTVPEKVQAIALCAAAQEPPPLTIGVESELDAMVRALLTLAQGAATGDRDQASRTAHNLIIEAVTRTVPTTDSRNRAQATVKMELPLDWGTALPRCTNPRAGVRFCEGAHQQRVPLDVYIRLKDLGLPVDRRRLTAADRGEDCECPRLMAKGQRAAGCPVLEVTRHPDTNDVQVTGQAHLFPRLDLPWPSWTLLELLAKWGYPPNLTSMFQGIGLKPRINPVNVENEYSNKVAGVVNRLNDLRDRLRCGWRNGEIDPAQGCGAPMTARFTYSVFPAVYGVTVYGDCAEAASAGPHDSNVYVNHCQGCKQIIDNRESTIRDDSGLNTYVCIRCGHGCDPHPPGSKCGKCGSYRIEGGWGRERVCQEPTCRHSFESRWN